jgi:hypothetical protein
VRGERDADEEEGQPRDGPRDEAEAQRRLEGDAPQVLVEEGRDGEGDDEGLAEDVCEDDGDAALRPFA